MGTLMEGRAVVYRKYPDRLENPGPVIGEMRRCRDVAIRAASSVKSHGVIYYALQIVVVAIDGAAHVITGHPYYFFRGRNRAQRVRAGAYRASSRL